MFAPGPVPAIREVLDASAPLPHHFLSEALPDMRRVCPKCDLPLFILHFRDLEVDFCHRCRGVWLEAGELKAIMKRAGAQTTGPLLKFLDEPGVEPKDHPHLCPRCDAPLREIQFEHAGSPPLTLDKCPRGHGLWFDDQELQQLLSMFPPESGTAIEQLNALFQSGTNK